jgi:tRNA threonylcarbamoyladenosine biosynthesis protein TsaE
MIEPSTKHTAKQPTDLDQIAVQFIASFPRGGIFCIYGEMGAGKTTFVHAICRALGLEFAGSPTFSLVNEYQTVKGTDLLHFDLYRLKNLEAALDIGMDEYLERKGYIMIEWPEIIQPILPVTAQKVGITVLTGDSRLIKF